MVKRLAKLFMVLACLVIAAGPVSAAELFRVRVTEAAIFAGFTNIPDGEWESVPPGDYFSTQVFAGERLATGSEAYQEDFVCAWSEAFTVDSEGQFNWTFGVFVCGEADTFEVDRRLRTGRVVASLPVVDCAAWNEETGECLEPIELGTLVIDLSLSATGEIQRYRSTSTGGLAGQYTYVYHGTGAARDANPAGTVTLDGQPLIQGATSISGQLVNASGGSVDVIVGG